MSGHFIKHKPLFAEECTYDQSKEFKQTE